MTAHALTLAVLAAVLATGCESSRAGAPAAHAKAPSGVVELRLGRVVSYGPLEIEWLEVDDSRCPTGVTCVWEGEAKASIEVTRAGAQALVVELVLRAGSDAAPIEAAGHRFELLAVEPYPVVGVTPPSSERLARIRVGPA